MNPLLALFIALQIYGAGNMNYQQEQGYYEINSLYTKHPSSREVYLKKAAETILVYGLSKTFPKHEDKILSFACGVSLSFIANDTMRGINIAVRF